MRISGKIGSKLFFLSKPSSESRSESEAITATIASLLLLVVTVALVGIVANVCDFSGSSAFSQTPVAKITIESCEGGLSNSGPSSERATFGKNSIVLMHEGGSDLPLDTVSIKISGYGNSYQGTANGSGRMLTGDMEVSYKNLSPKEKNTTYMNQNNATLNDDFWNTGEKLILHGRDSKSIHSSVKVNVGELGETKNNYGFKAGSEITVRVIDTKSNNIISEQTAVVKHAD